MSNSSFPNISLITPIWAAKEKLFALSPKIQFIAALAPPAPRVIIIAMTDKIISKVPLIWQYNLKIEICFLSNIKFSSIFSCSSCSSFSWIISSFFDLSILFMVNISSVENDFLLVDSIKIKWVKIY